MACRHLILLFLLLILIIESTSKELDNNHNIVLIGETGVGKSTIANVLLGFDHLSQSDNDCFKVSHKFQIKSQTKRSCMKKNRFLGKEEYPQVTVVDTPGFNSGLEMENAYKDIMAFLLLHNLQVTEHFYAFDSLHKYL